jgi:hypothetical protein
MQKRALFILTLLSLILLAYSQDSTKKTSNFHDVFASGYFYHLNDGTNYGMGIAGVYYKNVYVETRWNYEDLETFTLLGGYSFSNDQSTFQWELIPMFGFATGNTDAVIPALKIDLGYKKFGFYSDAEYAVSLEDKSSNYFYMWSEFTYAIKGWFQPGIVAQRTRLFKTAREIDRGFMINSNFLPRLTLSGYLFEPFEKDKTFYSFGLNFAF